MAAFVIPLRSDLADYDLLATLDGTTFLLGFRWNDRDGAWYMEVRTAAGDLILGSVKVVIRFPLGKRSTDLRMPKGMLVAVDTSGADLDPGFGDLGARVQLAYFPHADLVA